MQRNRSFSLSLLSALIFFFAFFLPESVFERVMYDSREGETGGGEEGGGRGGGQANNTNESNADSRLVEKNPGT